MRKKWFYGISITIQSTIFIQIIMMGINGAVIMHFIYYKNKN
jgi:hypothetical protein